jgi:FtsH-binding integral membrane protein
MSQRKVKETGSIAPGEILNENEQEDLIKSLQDKDFYLNFGYQLVLSTMSILISAYFYFYVLPDDKSKTPSIISILLTGIAPLFVLGTSSERVKSLVYQTGFMAFLLCSLIPIYLKGRVMDVFSIPFVMVLTCLMVFIYLMPRLTLLNARLSGICMLLKRELRS